MIDEIYEIIADHPFFENISPTYLKEIADRTERNSYDADQYLMRQGHEAEEFFLILKGSVCLYTDQLDPSSGKMIGCPIQTLGKEEIVGWSWLIPPYQWRFDAKAAEPTEVLVIDGKYLRRLCEDEPELGALVYRRVAYFISERLNATRMKLVAGNRKTKKKRTK